MNRSGAKHQKNQDIERLPEKRLSETGSAIVWIFIMIALFGALSIAISRGTRTGQSDISEEQARLYATEIIGYGRTLKNAIQEMQINECNDTEINFDNATVAGYTNAGAPSDDSCDVFDLDGAALRWLSPPDNANDGSDYFFTGALYVDNIGSDSGTAADADLLIVLPNVTVGVCEQINKLIGVTSSAATVADTGDADYSGSKFTGTYSAGDQLGGPLAGFAAGCFEGGGTPASGTYHFYQVLIAR